jgi:hypothetical protein
VCAIIADDCAGKYGDCSPHMHSFCSVPDTPCPCSCRVCAAAVSVCLSVCLSVCCCCVCLSAAASQCFRGHGRRNGERRRKSVRGCIVSPDLSVLNLVSVMCGEKGDVWDGSVMCAARDFQGGVGVWEAGHCGGHPTLHHAPYEFPMLCPDFIRLRPLYTNSHSSPPLLNLNSNRSLSRRVRRTCPA